MKPQSAPTVFVIDDDTEVRFSIQSLLKTAGLRSEAFGTAEEFLRNKESDGPSCLVLDVSLPGVSGLELQRKLADALAKTDTIVSSSCLCRTSVIFQRQA